MSRAFGSPVESIAIYSHENPLGAPWADPLGAPWVGPSLVESTQFAVYLAARYSRREELCFYRRQLDELGVQVTSRWLDGAHQVDADGRQLGDDGEAAVESGTDPVAGRFAAEDLEGLRAAHALVAFTEQPRATASRGGRHVELGVALERGIPVIVVGPRENVFCWLPDVIALDTWHEARAAIRALSLKAVRR